MTTHILIGYPSNLYVFDYEHYGLGSARFTGDTQDIEATWELVQRNASVAGSKGSLYRRPRNEDHITVVGGSRSARNAQA